MSDAVPAEPALPPPKRKKKAGTRTGNAGEYFVMGELLRQGFDAQLADRNTQGYDLLVGRIEDEFLRKVQVKTAKSGSWYVKLADFEGKALERITVYVHIGRPGGKKPIRYFIASNRQLAPFVKRQEGWRSNAFMPFKAVEGYEGKWDILGGEPPAIAP